MCAIRGGQGSLVVRTKAIKRAQDEESRLMFVTVVDANAVSEPGSSLAQALEAELTWMANVLVRIAQHHAMQEGVAAETAVRSGPLRATLASLLREAGPDVLMLGAPRGTTATVFGDDAVEQFARQLADETGVPVEVARPEELRLSFT